MNDYSLRLFYNKYMAKQEQISNQRSDLREGTQ